jgi:hypothetical protein
MEIAMTGKIIFESNSITVTSDGTITIPGSHPNQIATIKINNVELINSGIVIEKIANEEIIISGILSLHKAVIIPSINAKGIPINIAVVARTIEFFILGPKTSLMDICPLKENPKSN